MIAGGYQLPPSESGDPPCWAHLLDEARGDIVDRHDIELLVRSFYRDAAMDDLLGPAAMERLLAGVSAEGGAPVEPMWRRDENA
jgi:hypothetical protein